MKWEALMETTRTNLEQKSVPFETLGPQCSGSILELIQAWPDFRSSKEDVRSNKYET